MRTSFARVATSCYLDDDRWPRVPLGCGSRDPQTVQSCNCRQLFTGTGSEKPSVLCESAAGGRAGTPREMVPTPRRAVVPQDSDRGTTTRKAIRRWLSAGRRWCRGKTATTPWSKERDTVYAVAIRHPLLCVICCGRPPNQLRRSPLHRVSPSAAY